MQKSTLVWFRHDLRIEDNPALQAAIALKNPVVPLYIWVPDEEGGWPPGGASRWWLHYALAHLQEELAVPLIIRQGKSLETLQEVIAETGATHLFWNRRYEPWAIERDAAIKATFRDQGLLVLSFNGSLLYEPWTISNRQGKPFQVFTPFWKTCLMQGEPEAPLASSKLSKTAKCSSLKLHDLDLLPHIHWDAGIQKAWKPERPKEYLKRFHVENYVENRDRPDLEGTSRLSPFLHFGQLSPRTIWHAIENDAFRRQLGWREFAYHLLFHFPKTVDKPLHSHFAQFPWRYDRKDLNAWQKGNTGYPIVDAGMRQLWKTGWMHNRVRMIVGSFLVKDMLLPWLEGAKWFWDTLVDADLANNTLGWQWVAGCGADAAPYFRIFNPVLQGKKFDPQGAYVRHWVPELQSLPTQWLHQPWNAPEEVLQQSGISLGKTYPKPIVDHAQARDRALKALKSIKESYASH